jgi:starch synthase
VRVALLTREYPPEVYGGAGVHVEYLTRELAKLVEIEVHCFGGERSSPLVRQAYEPWDALPSSGGAVALQAMAIDLRMAANIAQAQVVHSHTWYANLGGHLAKLLYGIPHVMTAHSLEPLRPWKAEQLGGGYAVSSFCERSAVEAADAVIAVSSSMAEDLARVYLVDPSRIGVIHNGIDPAEYQPDARTDILDRFGIEAGRPTVIWIGRVTAQKGIRHLLDMAALMPREVQLVFLAGAPDTPEIGAEMSARAAALRGERGEGMHWIESMLPRSEVVQLLSHATVFVCPSLYEPFGLINLEAMACELPVVATSVGGIPEIVADGVTGYLVPVPDGEEGLGSALSERVKAVLEDSVRARAMGKAGRERVLERFTWQAIAVQTAELYASLV